MLHDAGTPFCHCCGAPLFSVTAPGPPPWEAAQHGQTAVAHFSAAVAPRGVERSPKSITLAVLLAGLLGPLGMVYCTLSGAIIMLVLSLSLVLASGDDFFQGNLYSLLITWPVCMVWAAIAAKAWNEGRI